MARIASFEYGLTAGFAIGAEVSEPQPPVAAYFFESLISN
jgi:hypothetical protein